MKPLRYSLAASIFGLACLIAVPALARQHQVRPGQSMSRIARRYHVDVWDLALANRMRPSDTLRPGMVLDVPSRHVTYVRPGQTLSHIARDHDCTVSELRRLNRLRGAGLRAGRRLVLPGYEPPEPPTPRDWGAPDEPGVVTILRRDETVEVRLLNDEREVTREGLEQLAELMRRHEGDEAELPHPRLAFLLAAISDHFGGREMTLVSGRRPAAGYTRESSRHVVGRATDIRLRGVPRRELWDFCRTLSDTGCGYYPRSTFVHVDVRARAAQWVDWSRPGRSPRYGNLSRSWPRFCRNRRRREHRLCRREGRHVSAPDEVPTEPVLTAEAQALYPEPPPEDEVPEDDEAAVEAEYETATDDDAAADTADAEADELES